jgi:hypothetical protein
VIAERLCEIFIFLGLVAFLAAIITDGYKYRKAKKGLDEIMKKLERKDCDGR